MSDIDKAREWAEWADKKLGVAESHANALAAAAVIQSLPDQIIDAEKLREVVSKYEGNTYISEIVQDFADLLLTPSLPTLAELIEQGNDPQKYVGMQCMMHDFPSTRVITKVRDSHVSALREDLEIQHATISKVTPLPDLPRLEWPGSGDAPTVAEQEQGNV